MLGHVALPGRMDPSLDRPYTARTLQEACFLGFVKVGSPYFEGIIEVELTDSGSSWLRAY